MRLYRFRRVRFGSSDGHVPHAELVACQRLSSDFTRFSSEFRGSEPLLSRRSTPSITELMELTLTKRPSNTAHRGGLKGALRLAHGICIWNMLHIHGGERQRGKPSQAVALTVSLSPFPLSLTLTAYAPQLSSRLVAPHGASNLSFTYTDTHVTIQLCSCCIWSPHLTT